MVNREEFFFFPTYVFFVCAVGKKNLRGGGEIMYGVEEEFHKKEIINLAGFFFSSSCGSSFKRIFFLSGGKNYVFCVEVKFYFLGDELSGEKKFKDRICLCFLCGTESNFFVKNNIFCMC